MAKVDNTPWDASKAWAAGAKSDDPAAFYNAICAGKCAGDPATQEAHALPHHYNPGDPPNAAGVRNSLARFGQTKGLTNQSAAKSHLDGHMTTIQAQESDMPLSARAQRALHPKRLPGGAGRVANFPTKLRGSLVTVNGKQFFEVDGYATTFNQPYKMWDEFGPFTEIADAHMLDGSLARGPDVAFLTNHKGITMARTKNGSLELGKDDHGLKIHALLNIDRTDVKDLASAISDNLIDEMSFAFLLTDGEWSEDYTQFTILEADINRGDVSAVNYGANPYTSIGARAQEFFRALEDMPNPLRAEAVSTILSGDDGRSIMRAAVTLTRQSTERYARAADVLSGFKDWDIEDLTGEGADASTGEFADADKRASKERLAAMIASEDEIPAEQSGGKTDEKSATHSDDSVKLYANRWEMVTDESV